MKPSPISKLILFPLLALTVAQFACSLGAQPPSAAPQQPDASLPAPSDSATSAPEISNAGQIVISGAVSKTYAPARVEASNVGDRTVLFLYEKKTGSIGVSLQFPVDTQPGTYTVVDIWGDQTVAAIGEYFVLNGVDEIRYSSAKGTLTLTTVGSKFSGQFQFTAVDSNDASKTIEVSGSFADVPLNP